MGISASGHIYFGVYYGEEDPRWLWDEEREYRTCPDDRDEDEHDWEEWLCKLAGLENPYRDPVVETMPEQDYHDRSLTYDQRRQKYESDRAAWDEEHSDWVVKKNVYREARKVAVEACPVELITVGHYDYPVKCLALRGTHLYDDFAGSEITKEHFHQVTPERISEAMSWCEEHGIDWPEPKWLLTGSMG